MRSAQDRRIATESAEEREARLQQLRVAQQQRIATETSEEIEARRAQDRRNHMDLKTAEVPLFQQTRVCFKMRQFHSRLKSVCVPWCVTKVSMHLSISHSLCRRSSRSPIMLSILLVLLTLARACAAKGYCSRSTAPVGRVGQLICFSARFLSNSVCCRCQTWICGYLQRALGTARV